MLQNFIQIRVIDLLPMSSMLVNLQYIPNKVSSKGKTEGGVKMAEEYDGEITFSSTNSSKEQQNGEQSLQNTF